MVTEFEFGSLLFGATISPFVLPIKVDGKFSSALSNLAMYVLKRNGRQERVQFDKITSRITKLAYGLNTQFVDPGAP